MTEPRYIFVPTLKPMSPNIGALLTFTSTETQMDELDLLLKEAKTQMYQRKRLEIIRKATLPKPPPLKQAERSDWKVGKTVCLIHKADDGTETALGLFIEHLRDGTRWLRPTHDTLSPDHAEIVTGAWWLCPRIREIPMDSEGEVLAIRARFEALVESFVKEYNLPPVEASTEDLEEEEEEDIPWDPTQSIFRY